MDELAEECMERFPHVKITPSTFTKIYYAAKMDLAKTLVAALNDIEDNEVCNYLLNVKFEERDGQSLTPLVLAIHSGHLTFVRTILSHYQIDLETECNVIFDGGVVYGATALWVAAGTGHLNIVKVLVQHGADINHNTKAQSSPLRAACYDGRCEIVTYLIEHGANVNLANNFNNTCLMIASYKGHGAVIQALLQNGADPNRQALCGATALHYAAECGHLDICELLLNHGAELIKNEHGLTPVIQAADRTRENVVIMFARWPDIMSKEEKINAIELLGASFANDKDNYDVGKAFQFLMKAMVMRYEDSDNIIRKRTIPPVPAYDNWIETETVQDLQAIRLNHHFIHMESLTIRERILGQHYPDLSQAIVYRGAIFADLYRFDMCCKLWTYAIDLRMANGDSVDRDLLRFAQLFSQMIRLEQNPEVSAVLSILERCQKEIERNKRKMTWPGPKDIPGQIADELDNNIVTALYLIKIITVLIGAKDGIVNKQQITQLYSIITGFIKTNTRLRDGQTLLHRAVNGVTPVDDYHTNQICRFPCLHTSRLLVHAGASVNDEDCERNTPLHVLISSLNRDSSSSISNAEKIIQLFANAGAHIDAVNAQGLTPAQLASATALSIILQKYQNKHTTLRCLAARIVAIHKLEYKGHVPKFLEVFVRMHSAEKVQM